MQASYWEDKYWPGTFDFLIIGMGYTGLATAIELKAREPKARIAIVDRAAWSRGASLRNAGFACFANLGEMLADLETQNEEEVYALCKDRFDGLQSLKNKYGSQIDYTENGSYESFSKSDKRSLEKCLDYLQRANKLMYGELGLDRVFTYSSKSFINSGMGSIENAYEGSINTAKLYDALRQEALEKGVECFGGCTYESHEGEQVLDVKFVEGQSLKSKHLLFCTNAFASEHSNEDIVPARGTVFITQPFDHSISEGIHMYNQGYYYWRALDGRILLGGARNLDKEGETTKELSQNPKIVSELKRFLQEEIVGSEVQIAQEWSGIMAMSNDGSKRPIIKKLEKSVFLAARLGGMGVALSAQTGKQLAELVLNP